jgi:outer membrane beta-barrel protein
MMLSDTSFDIRDKTGTLQQNGLGPHFSVHLGIGEKFHVLDWLAIDVSLTDTLYSDRPDFENRSVLQNLVSLTWGCASGCRSASTTRSRDHDPRASSRAPPRNRLPAAALRAGPGRALPFAGVGRRGRRCGQGLRRQGRGREREQGRPGDAGRQDPAGLGQRLLQAGPLRGRPRRRHLAGRRLLPEVRLRPDDQLPRDGDRLRRLHGSYLLNTPGGAVNVCGSEGCRSPQMSDLDSVPGNVSVLAGLEVAWSPFYGKVNIMAEKVLHFDTSIFIGGDLIMYGAYDPKKQVNGVTVGGNAQTPTAGGHIGIGERVVFNDFLALRIELRDYMYAGKTLLDTEFQNQLMLEIGVSFFLGSGSRD